MRSIKFLNLKNLRMNGCLPQRQAGDRVVRHGYHAPVESVLVLEIILRFLESQVSVPNAARVVVQPHSDDGFVVCAS